MLGWGSQILVHLVYLPVCPGYREQLGELLPCCVKTCWVSWSNHFPFTSAEGVRYLLSKSNNASKTGPLKCSQEVSTKKSQRYWSKIIFKFRWITGSVNAKKILATSTKMVLKIILSVGDVITGLYDASRKWFSSQHFKCYLPDADFPLLFPLFMSGPGRPGSRGNGLWLSLILLCFMASYDRVLSF